MVIAKLHDEITRLGGNSQLEAILATLHVEAPDDVREG